jgi:hypothetical protein
MAVLSLLLMIEAGVVTLAMQLAARYRRARLGVLLLGLLVGALTIGLGAWQMLGELGAMIAMTAVLALTLMVGTVLGGRR